MTVGKGLKVNAVRRREEVARTGQAGADGVRHEGPAVGGRVADLPALEAQARRCNDKLLILEDTDGDGKADTCTGVRRPAPQPDRVRVLQRRRHRRAGAGPDVPQGHQRRRQGRRPRARPPRARLGRHAPHRQQLRARPGRARSTSRKARSTTRRSKTPTARRSALANGGVFRYEPRTQKFDIYVTYALRQPARPRLRPLGPGHRRRRHRREPYHAATVLRPPRVPGQARPPAAGSDRQRTRPCARHWRFCPAEHFPAELARAT